MYKILLLEDGKETQVMVKAALSQGFILTIAESVVRGRELARSNNFDLFIVDINLPDGDGFHFCSELRNDFKTKNTPVFFLSSKSESQDKVLGFSIGADDYIVKPFDAWELKARINARLKKINEGKLTEEPIISGQFMLEILAQKAYRISKGVREDLQLSPHEFKLLYFLIRNEGLVLTREFLLNSIWGDSLHVSDRTVDAHICNLRKKLSLNTNFVESVFGQGYRLKTLEDQIC